MNITSNLSSLHAQTHESTRQFFGAKRDLLSVAFSADNRQILTAGRDRAVRLYNTIGEVKLTIDDAHSDWITAVRYSPSQVSSSLTRARRSLLLSCLACFYPSLVRNVPPSTSMLLSLAQRCPPHPPITPHL